MKNYVQKGDSLTLIATAIVTAGTPTQVGALVVVPHESAAVGQPFVGMRCGVYRCTTTITSDKTAGSKAYLKADGSITEVASGNTLVGAFTQDVSTGATEAEVLFTGQVV
ncbi:capsid cement protein [Ferrimonas pelagia]|uniref:DUF2190 family protein n=1 Tax=Ferrimonas pelagia TaxID=1177826 RepID=A0ABP9EJC2_9GAMM